MGGGMGGLTVKGGWGVVECTEAGEMLEGGVDGFTVEVGGVVARGGTVEAEARRDTIVVGGV